MRRRRPGPPLAALTQALFGALALAGTLLAAGCGQKGPLYLPDKNPPVITNPPAQPSPSQPSRTQTAPASPAPQPAAGPPSGEKPPRPTDKPTDEKSDTEAPK